MIYYFGIALVLAIICRITNEYTDTTIGVIINKIFIGTEIICLASCFITSIMRIWARFINNIYKDESYLTHTLPVSKSEIWNSKVISGIFSVIITIIVVFVSVAIMWLNSTTTEIIKDYFETLAQIFGNFEATLVIIGVVLLVIFEVILFMFSGIFGILVGFSCNNGKIIRSILVGVMMYSFLTSFLLIIMFGISIINPTFMELYSSDIPSPKAMQMLTYVSLLIYLIYDIGYYFIGKILLKKGVNVD